MVKSSACSPIDSLVDLACRDGVDIRPTLLRVITDLYVQKPSHTAEEETQYAELALGLIASADEPTRAAVTVRLAAYPAAPPAVLAKLGVTPAKAREPESDDLADLFFAASPEERRLILANLDVAAGPARLPALANGDLLGHLEAAALRHNADEFSRTLERTLGLSRALAEQVTRDTSGEPMVVAAKALGMSAAMLQRILLVLNPAIGQSVERVYALAELFDELSLKTAAHMVEIWRGIEARPRPLHEPVYWDDERRGANARSPHRRESAGRRDPQPRRSTHPDRNESRA